MKIIELVQEQTIGTVGSTTAAPQTVSQTTSPDTKDPNVQKLAATLRQNKIIDNEKQINDFLSAYQAQQTGNTLNPAQQASMAKLAGALMKNRNLDQNLDLQIKTMSQQKPQQTQKTPSTNTPVPPQGMKV